MESGQRRQRDRSSGQVGLFDACDQGGDGSGSRPLPPLPRCDPWSERQVLGAEKESLGFYVTGHPLESHRETLQRIADTTTGQLAKARPRSEVAVAGLIVSIRKLKTRKGESMAVVVIEDLVGQAEIVVFPKVYTACGDLLVEDASLLFRGRVEASDDAARMIASEVLTFEQAQEQVQKSPPQTVEIVVDLSTAEPELPSRLCDVLERHRGNIPVRVNLQRSAPDGFLVSLAPNRYLFVEPTGGLVEELESLVGPERIRLLG